jgi:hypothetical protein
MKMIWYVCMVFRIEAFDQGESGGKGWSASVTRSNRKNKVDRAHASMRPLFGLLVIIPTRQYSAHIPSHYLGHEDARRKAYFTKWFQVGITDHDDTALDPRQTTEIVDKGWE